MYYVLKSICIIKGTLVVFDVVLAHDVQRTFSIAHDVFKEKLIHRFIIVLFRVIDFILDFCIGNTVFIKFAQDVLIISLVGFVSYLSFTEHFILLTLFPFSLSG